MGLSPASFFSFNFLYDTYHYLTSYTVYLFLWLLSASAPQLECRFHEGRNVCLFCIPEWMAGPRMAFNKCLLNEWKNRNIYKHSYSWLNLTFLVNKMESYHRNSSAFFFSFGSTEQNVGSVTRNGICIPCRGSWESESLAHHGSPPLQLMFFL